MNKKNILKPLRAPLVWHPKSFASQERFLKGENALILEPVVIQLALVQNKSGSRLPPELSFYNVNVLVPAAAFWCVTKREDWVSLCCQVDGLPKKSLQPLFKKTLEYKIETVLKMLTGLQDIVGLGFKNITPMNEMRSRHFVLALHAGFEIKDEHLSSVNIQCKLQEVASVIKNYFGFGFMVVSPDSKTESTLWPIRMQEENPLFVQAEEYGKVLQEAEHLSQALDAFGSGSDLPANSKLGHKNRL